MRKLRWGLGLVLALGCIALPTLAEGPSNWPRFRGINGTGISLDKDVPTEWSANKNLLWKVALPGLGNSSPIVWGDRVFLQTASTDGKERSLVCLNLSDGKLRWQKKAPGEKAKINARNSLASSTPATDGERVYAAFWDGKDIAVHAFDLDGKPLWQRPLGAFVSQHGAGLSPMVHDGKVYINLDQDGKAALVALDAKSGKVAWQKDRKPFRACYSTPFLLTKSDNSTELIVVSTAGVTGYNPQTGAEVWNWNWKFGGMALRTVGSAAAAHGLVFAYSGDGKGDRHTVAVKVGDKGDVSATPPAWESTKGSMPYVPSVLVWGEHLYYVNDKGEAFCHVARTGEEVWRQQLGRGVSASPVLIDGKIYAVSEDGEAYVFAAEPQFRLIATSSVGEPVFASPAVAQGKLLIRGRQHLYCIGRK